MAEDQGLLTAELRQEKYRRSLDLPVRDQDRLAERWLAPTGNEGRCPGAGNYDNGRAEPPQVQPMITVEFTHTRRLGLFARPAPARFFQLPQHNL